MLDSLNKKKTILLLLPFFGIIIFIFLYILATRCYPGGSQIDRNAEGFSWSQNYWCNLLSVTAINGQPNKARPIAMMALIILSVALSIFWIQFPLHSNLSKSIKRIFQLSGLITQITAMFLFTALHDLVINVATLFGLVAMCGTLIIIYKLNWKILFWLGTINLLLILLNNILYYRDGLIQFLPVVQKITFLYFLLWISLIDIRFFKERSHQPDSPNPSQTDTPPLL